MDSGRRKGVGWTPFYFVSDMSPSILSTPLGTKGCGKSTLIRDYYTAVSRLPPFTTFVSATPGRNPIKMKYMVMGSMPAKIALHEYDLSLFSPHSKPSLSKVNRNLLLSLIAFEHLIVSSIPLTSVSYLFSQLSNRTLREKTVKAPLSFNIHPKTAHLSIFLTQIRNVDT